MDPHLHGQQPDAFDGRERLFSGQRGRGGVLRPSQAGVLPQAQLRGRLDGRVHQHAQRLHGLVPGQADQDGVRHEHHGSSTRARSCGMIGGDGINDESNKTAPAPNLNFLLNKNIPSRGARPAVAPRLAGAFRDADRVRGLGEVHAFLVQQARVLGASRLAHQLPRRIFDAVERPTVFPATVFVSVASGHLTLLAVGQVLQRSLEPATLYTTLGGCSSRSGSPRKRHHLVVEC